MCIPSCSVKILGPLGLASLGLRQKEHPGMFTMPDGTLRDLGVHLGLEEFCLLVSKPETAWVTGTSLSGFQHHHECLQHFKGQSTGCDQAGARVLTSPDQQQR